MPKQILSALLTCFTATTVQAAIVQITSPGQMQTDVLQTFEQTIDVPGAITFEDTAFLESASAATSGVTPSGTGGLLQPNAGDEPLSVVFEHDFYAVGLYFGNDDFNLQFEAKVEAFDVTMNSLGFVTVAANGNDFADQFIGMLSDTAIRSVQISYARPQAQRLGIYLDDFRVGSVGADPSAVPEPGTVILVSAGMLAFGTARRLRCKRTIVRDTTGS